MRRREFLTRAASLPLATTSISKALAAPSPAKPRLFFTSSGKTCSINADGSGFRPMEFNAPNQVTWQPTEFFPDGRRVLLLSMEERRDGPGRPFSQYYHKTPTHLWIYDLEKESLTEICANREKLATFCTPALLLGGDRMLVQVVRDEGGLIYSVNLDGSDVREFTRVGEGLPYGLSLSPDGKRVAFHLASPQGYQVWTSNSDGGDRVKVAAHPDHLYFGPMWSPDGKWISFEDCLFKADPGHDWCDICIARPDGKDFHALTEGQASWFAATYGPPENRGGGSNLPHWTRGGEILFFRRLPGSKVPWEFQAQREDVDHFNRDFKPKEARGGTEICRMNTADGSVTRLTKSEPPVWDFRAAESPDRKLIAFCRCATGDSPSLWCMNADGSGQRRLTKGIENKGCDHPRWLPEAKGLA